MSMYDAYEEEMAGEKGKDYSYSGTVGLSVTNDHLMEDWKYAPAFKILMKANIMQFIAVFILLSIYIAIISMAGIGIMAYVRSITIALDNKKLFMNLKRLGKDIHISRCSRGGQFLFYSHYL